MDVGRLLKWAFVIAVIVIAWKVVLPWLRNTGTGSSTTTTVAAGDNSCSGAAQRASEAWGSGLRQFVNPPYDVNAWSTFRGEVESKITSAELQCNCSAESCVKTRGALTDLRGLISDLDRSIRNGSEPPSDAVSRQDSIDTRISEAAAGK